MMVKFSRHELRELSLLCARTAGHNAEIIADEETPAFFKALALHEKEYVESLSAKLDEIILSDAKRVKITY